MEAGGKIPHKLTCCVLTDETALGGDPIKMERMTHQRNNGIKTGYWSPNTKEALVQRLAAYENTGLEPYEINVAIVLEAKKALTKTGTDMALAFSDGIQFYANQNHNEKKVT